MTFKLKMVLVLAISIFLYVPPSAYAQKFYLEDSPNIKKAEQAVMRGNLEEAAKFYHKAVNSGVLDRDRLLPTLNNLCIVEYALAHADNAEAACTLAIKEDSRFWQAYVNRANARYALGNELGAIEDYRIALQLNPKNDSVKQVLASIENGKIYAQAR